MEAWIYISMVIIVFAARFAADKLLDTTSAKVKWAMVGILLVLYTVFLEGFTYLMLRQPIVDLEVREYGIEDVNKYDEIKIQFYENDREDIWFRIIDKETIWDYSEALTKGNVIVYKTDVDLLELISKY